MLKKAISTSKKLSNLSTDSARLLYTWLLPHLDVEGRFYADPDIVKGTVVPRLKNMTVKNVESYLFEMQELGLIILYRSNGDTYLQLKNFEKHQSLRKDREKASEIPTPTDTPVLCPATAGRTPEQDKIREVKLREDIYSFWNDAGIIQHKDIGKFKTVLSATLKVYEPDEIKETITNYKTILESDEHYYTHKYTLKDFLKRKFDDFRTINNPFENFKNKDFKSDKEIQKDRHTKSMGDIDIPVYGEKRK